MRSQWVRMMMSGHHQSPRGTTEGYYPHLHSVAVDVAADADEEGLQALVDDMAQRLDGLAEAVSVAEGALERGVSKGNKPLDWTTYCWAGVARSRQGRLPLLLTLGWAPPCAGQAAARKRHIA